MNKRSSVPDILTGESSKLTADYLRKNGAVIPDNVRTVYEDALSDCGDLKKLIVPDERSIASASGVNTTNRSAARVIVASIRTSRDKMIFFIFLVCFKFRPQK